MLKNLNNQNIHLSSNKLTMPLRNVFSMAKNTKNLNDGEGIKGRSILVKEAWLTLGVPIPNVTRKQGNNEYIKDVNIKSYIEGFLLKIGILSSDIYISKNALGHYNVYLYYYPLQLNKLIATQNGSNLDKSLPKSFDVWILKIIKILKLIFSLKYPQNTFKFVFIRAPHKFIHPKILNDYIHWAVVEDPNKIQPILLSLIREFKMLRILRGSQGNN